MKISYYLFVRLVVQKLIDNLLLLCQVNEANNKAKLIFFEWIFKNVFLKTLPSAK